MNDFENRLTTALRETGERAPSASDLAASARERRRWQIRTRYGVGLGVAAATAAAVLVVPQVVGGADGPDREGPAIATEGRGWIPEGWRNETVGEVELAVPADMPYGDITQWCVGEAGAEPVFSRPGGASTSAGCPTTYGYGVTVLPIGQSAPVPTGSDPTAVTYPEGAAVRNTVLAGRTVLAVFENEQLAEDVIATAHRNQGTDANGCATTRPIAKVGSAGPLDAGDGPISVCRYGQGERGNLLQSELLDASESDEVRRVIEAAPAGTGPDASEAECLDVDTVEPEAVLFRTGAGPLAWVHYSLCRGHAVDLGDSTRRLTPEVMHWALSPGWSGGLSIPGLLTEVRSIN